MLFAAQDLFGYVAGVTKLGGVLVGSREVWGGSL